jgi:small subunit ribosomal protein S5
MRRAITNERATSSRAKSILNSIALVSSRTLQRSGHEELGLRSLSTSLSTSFSSSFSTSFSSSFSSYDGKRKNEVGNNVLVKREIGKNVRTFSERVWASLRSAGTEQEFERAVDLVDPQSEQRAYASELWRWIRPDCRDAANGVARIANDAEALREKSRDERNMDIDSGRKLMKDWTPRETLEFIARGATPQDARDFMDEETIMEYEDMQERIDKAPAKQKRFLLNQALKGRVFASVLDEEDKDEREKQQIVKSLQQKVIDVNRTCKVTKGGGIMNFTAMVVVGNGRGVVGFATGKANEVGPAIEKATKKAARSLTFVERFEDHTIFQELHGKCAKTKVKMMPSNSGSGRRCNDIIDAICELAGIKDVKAKVTGSHHPHNTVRAVFEAFASMQSPADVAARRGMKVFQV